MTGFEVIICWVVVFGSVLVAAFLIFMHHALSESGWYARKKAENYVKAEAYKDSRNPKLPSAKQYRGGGFD